MRNNLKENVEQLGLVEGTITSWSNNSKYRDLVINHLTVKLHDTNLKPNHQNVISKEKHLHIFIKQEDMKNNVIIVSADRPVTSDYSFANCG